MLVPTEGFKDKDKEKENKNTISMLSCRGIGNFSNC